MNGANHLMTGEMQCPSSTLSIGRARFTTDRQVITTVRQSFYIKGEKGLNSFYE